MFKNNKYKKYYDNIIFKAKLENRKKYKTNNVKYSYYELHHILPKSMGGSNDKENLVLLTSREHYICHLLLARCVTFDYVYKMIHALARFQKYAETSRKYELFSVTMKKFSKGNLNKSFGKMWCYMKEDNNKIFFITKNEFDEKTMVKGLPYQRGGNHGNIWVKTETEQKLIQKSELDFHLENGWSKGRLTKMSEEHMKNMNKKRHTPEKDKKHSDKMKYIHKVKKDAKTKQRTSF